MFFVRGKTFAPSGCPRALTNMLIFVSLLGCQPGKHPVVAIDALQIPKTLHITSHTFVNGGTIPLANSDYGKGISPDLSWSKVPAKTQSLLLLVQDPDTPQGLFTHWILYDISASARSLPAGLPAKRGTLSVGLQGDNDMGTMGYFGPRPPDTPAHHYHFQIFALNSRLRPRPGYGNSVIYAMIHDHAICGGDLVGVFKKP